MVKQQMYDALDESTTGRFGAYTVIQIVPVASLCTKCPIFEWNEIS